MNEWMFSLRPLLFLFLFFFMYFVSLNPSHYIVFCSVPFDCFRSKTSPKQFFQSFKRYSIRSVSFGQALNDSLYVFFFNFRAREEWIAFTTMLFYRKLPLMKMCSNLYFSEKVVIFFLFCCWNKKKKKKIKKGTHMLNTNTVMNR